MKKPQEVVEISKWMFPAFALSGWLSPIILLLNIIGEALGLW
jgi:hypothetical protein